MEVTVDKCLAFCQVLAKSNQKFFLNLTIVNFSFTYKELASRSWQKKEKKKFPSQVRREAKRKQEHNKKVAEEVTDVIKLTAKVIRAVSAVETDDILQVTKNLETFSRFNVTNIIMTQFMKRH